MNTIPEYPNASVVGGQSTAFRAACALRRSLCRRKHQVRWTSPKGDFRSMEPRIVSCCSQYEFATEYKYEKIYEARQFNPSSGSRRSAQRTTRHRCMNAHRDGSSGGVPVRFSGRASSGSCGPWRAAADDSSRCRWRGKNHRATVRGYRQDRSLPERSSRPARQR